MLSRLIEKPGGSFDLHAGPRHGGYPRHRLATMTLKALATFPRLCHSLCTLDRAFTPSAPMLWCCGTQVAGPSQRSEIGCVPPVQRSIILSVSPLAPSMPLLPFTSRTNPYRQGAREDEPSPPSNTPGPSVASSVLPTCCNGGRLPRGQPHMLTPVPSQELGF